MASVARGFLSTDVKTLEGLGDIESPSPIYDVGTHVGRGLSSLRTVASRIGANHGLLRAADHSCCQLSNVSRMNLTPLVLGHSVAEYIFEMCGKSMKPAAGMSDADRSRIFDLSENVPHFPIPGHYSYNWIACDILSTNSRKVSFGRYVLLK